MNDGSHNLHAQLPEVDVWLFDGQDLLNAKTRALGKEDHHAVRLRNQRKDQKELLDGENHRSFATFADALDFDQFHRIPLPLDHLPQHGLLIQTMYDGLDVSFGLGGGFEASEP